MTEELLIRKIAPEEAPYALSFFVSRYPAKQREIAFEKRAERWRWQYFSHPCGEPGIWIAKLGERIVGIIGTNSVRISTPKGIIKAVWAGDLLIDPSVRGKGLGKRLVDAWKESGDTAVGKGFNEIAYSLYRNRGFEGVTGFTSIYIVLSKMRLAAKFLLGGERKKLSMLARSIAKPASSLARSAGFSISTKETLPPETLTLWRTIAGRYRFAFERDERYLKWRFLEHPRHRHSFLELKRDGVLSGLAIVRIGEGKNPLGVVLDLFVDPTEKELVLELMRGTLAFLASKGACAALMELPPALAPTICNAFPCSIQSNFPMVLYTKDTDLIAEGFYDSRAWYISRSDSDADY